MEKNGHHHIIQDRELRAFVCAGSVGMGVAGTFSTVNARPVCCADRPAEFMLPSDDPNPG